MRMFADQITGAVNHWTYRSARVADLFLELSRSGDSEAYAFEKALAEKAGVSTDKHTVYGIQYNGSTVYAWFTDEHAYFGWRLVEGGR